jgi:hypothetical protein
MRGAGGHSSVKSEEKIIKGKGNKLKKLKVVMKGQKF